VEVLRTWKRDGSTNRMDMTPAVEHLARRLELDADPAENRRRVRQALIGWLTRETPLASFARVDADHSGGRRAARPRESDPRRARRRADGTRA